ncbi:hypothetical protein AMJ40_04990 [candidate division TA06 bacterium DG_26]|uniref:Uncharacterized protein n=1 Tax=candidate division TA06 bacterium DG_26 TaxID=1703771 RepID=A0A0S7WHM0_UNCT6|nr:MAG: hypothetical protein AMJ40_04990 [candidate division TA06 bacterium DG_26]
MRESILYSVVFLLSLCCGFSAQSYWLSNSAAIANDSGAPGDTGIYVAVSLDNDEPVSRFRFEISFDTDILLATRVELATRTEDFGLSGAVGTENYLWFEGVAQSGEHLEVGVGPIAYIVFSVDDSAAPGTQSLINFIGDSCTVWDTLGVALCPLVLVNGIFTVISVGIEDEWVLKTEGVCTGVRSYPNPFVERTTIELIVPTSTGKEDVALEIFDGAGRSVTTLTHSVRKGNRCLFHWSGTDRKGTKLPSGIYLLLPRGEGVAEELRTKGERLILLRQKG